MPVAPEILFAKTQVRKMSRELIRVIFVVSEPLPPIAFKVEIRKKVLGISSFVSHATVQTEKETQAAYYLAIMNDIREVLKLLNQGKVDGQVSDKSMALSRLSITDLIQSLDRLTKLLGCFN